MGLLGGVKQVSSVRDFLFTPRILFLALAVVFVGVNVNQSTVQNPILTQASSGSSQGGSGAALADAALLDVPPRRMWGWGAGMNGYCGETSIQSAGIFFGNYWSQERVRYADGNEELLIGVNDVKAAKALKLDYEAWDYERKKTPQASEFLSWIKNHINQGHPVVAGWYEKQPRGDEDYDHIMPIIGYEDVSRLVRDADGKLVAVPTSTNIYHNDLYLQETSITLGKDAFKSRKGCSQSKSPVQPYDYCLPDEYDYGLAIKGNVDPNKETFRTFLTVSIWTEPDWGAEDKKHEKPIQFTAFATVTGLTPGKKYALLRFDKADDLGDSKNFLQKKWAKKYEFVADSDTYVYEDLDPMMSDGTYFFRCVEA